MRAIPSWLAINALLIGVNALCAGALYGLFVLARSLFPSAMESPWVTYPIGIAGIAATLALAFKVARLIESRLRYRARARG